MKFKFLSAVSAMLIAGAANAADVSGKVSLDMTTNANDDVVTSTDIEINVNAADTAFVSLGLGADATTGDIDLETYSLGTIVNGVTLSFGKQKDLFATPGLNAVGGETLANPADDYVSLRAGIDALSVQLGFDDVTNDMSDIKNVQVAYGSQFGAISIDTAVDYDFGTEDSTIALGTAVDAGFAITSLAVTYNDSLAYELSLSNYGVSAYLNGDESDALQNIGAGYSNEYNGLGYYAEVGYNLDTDEVTPAVGVSFSF